jgi:tryptophanyl-tRNA synthetase
MSEPVKEDFRKTVLSCIQPTGKLHLGRYFGAIQNWVGLQSRYDCFYGVVDYHALTMPFDPKKMRNSSWDLVFDLIAAGLDPDNLFVQSLVPEHAELGWILSCMTSYGELSRMTQFKDKSQQSKETSKDAFISAGLYTYPVLQAADILIYRADYVPVGKDQEQHLELTRNIAQRFNNIVGKEYFLLPEPLYTEVPKVMSTADPEKKMSASLGPKHHIDVFEDPNVVSKQIRSAVTDSGDVRPGTMSPGVENLFQLLKASGRKQDAYEELLNDYREGGLQYGKLKSVVGEALVEMTEPMREKRREISKDKRTYKDRVRASSEVIRKVAQQTLAEVKDLVGLLNVRY